MPRQFLCETMNTLISQSQFVIPEGDTHPPTPISLSLHFKPTRNPNVCVRAMFSAPIPPPL